MSRWVSATPFDPRERILELPGILAEPSQDVTVRSLETAGFRQRQVGLGVALGSQDVLEGIAPLAELLSLQDVRGQAKAYRVRQLLALIERYNLTIED